MATAKKTTKASKPRKPPNRLPAAQKVVRDYQIIEDRLRPMTWDRIAEKHNLSVVQCKVIFAQHRDQRKPRLAEVDPFDLVWESVERYEGWIEQLTDIAISGDTDSARVGAINTQARLQGQRDSLLQMSGILPQNLGKLKVEHDVRFIAQTVVSVMREDDIPVETQRRVLRALRPAAVASN